MPSDFSGQNLRGRSFKGQDLSGADFSGADIRGVNFTKANLQGTDFTGAKAGLRHHSAFALLISSLILSAITGAFAAFTLYLIVRLFVSGIPGYELVVTTSVWEKSVTFYRVVTLHGLNVALECVIVAVAGCVAGVITTGVSGCIATAIVVAVSVTNVGLGTGAVAVGVVVTAAVVGIGAGAIVFINAGAVVVIASGGYMAWCAIKGNKRYKLVRDIAVALATLGGTSFRDTNLTHAIFTHAKLKNTDFRRATVTQTLWRSARQIDFSRFGSTVLIVPAVQSLLVTGQGSNKRYIRLNLKGANFSGADLTEADLTEADISAATLEGAVLERANLTKTQALGTSFYQTNLTGACLEGWNIDSTTKLDGAICEYIYLLNGQRERRPSSGNFAPGEFTKLFQEALSTIDLIFRNGIDWKAFTYSFNQLVLDNEGTELSIQSIENKGDGVVVVRVNAPPDANKAQLHSEFNQSYETAVKALEAKYHAELKAKDEQITIYRQQSANMQEITRLMASRPVTVEVNAKAESKSMNDSTDSSRNLNVSGNLTATGSTFNLGEINGNVTNTLNQLQTSDRPEAAQLADLLKQLQDAINAEPELKPDDRNEALEQIGAIAKAGQDPQNGTLKKLANTGIKVIKGTIAVLPSTATLVEAGSKLLPAIVHLLGL